MDYLSQNLDCLFAQNEPTYYRQKSITSASLMHFYIEPDIKTMCSWTKRELIMSPIYASYNFFYKVWIMLLTNEIIR